MLGLIRMFRLGLRSRLKDPLVAKGRAGGVEGGAVTVFSWQLQPLSNKETNEQREYSMG
jgi:hypothetical protein